MQYLLFLAVAGLIISLLLLWRVRKPKKPRVVKVTPITIPGTSTVIKFQFKRFIASLILIAFILANGASCLLTIGSREFWEVFLWTALYFNVFVLIIFTVIYLFLWGIGLLDDSD